MKTKTCSRCKQEKTADSFYRRKMNKDGMALYCKKCARDIEIKCLENNRSKNLKTGFVEKQLTCRICKQVKSSKLFYRDVRRKSGFEGACKSCHSLLHRFGLYGISLENIKGLLQEQDEKCAICNSVLDNHFHIDHCHKTNFVRGILCNRCNVGLGMFSDNPALLQSAVSYLKQSSVKEKSHVV